MKSKAFYEASILSYRNNFGLRSLCFTRLFFGDARAWLNERDLKHHRIEPEIKRLLESKYKPTPK